MIVIPEQANNVASLETVPEEIANPFFPSVKQPLPIFWPRNAHQNPSCQYLLKRIYLGKRSLALKSPLLPPDQPGIAIGGRSDTVLPLQKSPDHLIGHVAAVSDAVNLKVRFLKNPLLELPGFSHWHQRYRKKNMIPC